MRPARAVAVDEASVRVGVLGPFEVLRSDVPAGPAGAKRRGLLAALALEAGGVVPVSTLVDLLWGEEPVASATHLVQTYVSSWRKVVGPERLRRVGTGYRLLIGADESDLLAFRSAAAGAREAAHRGDHAEAARALSGALRLWRGPALADLVGTPVHDRYAPALDADRTAVTEAWARATLLCGGDPALVVSAMAAVSAREPLRESAVELLLWAHAAAGESGRATEVFHETRHRLRDELGADPGRALSRMHERVLTADPALFAPPAGAAATRRRDHTTLAFGSGDSFVGRDRELEEVSALVGARRLVTLTGPGGAGKSRLAAEVLDLMLAEDGTGWFAELAEVDDIGSAPTRIAAAVGIQVAAGRDPVAALLDHLGGAHGLLVLDNVEQLAGVGDLVSRLLRGTQHLRVLATSREPLRIGAEQQFPVPLLPTPAADESDATSVEGVASVRLLVDRARAGDPSFVVTEDNAADLAEIARRLDGLPLALETASPWLRLLTPAGLLARLIAPLDLPARRADLAPRHRSLRDTVGWSVDLLPARQGVLVARLSVFAGSFTLAAAEGVCAGLGDPRGGDGDVAADLLDLVERNLVQRHTSGPEPRFRLLVAVRSFAAELVAAHDRIEDLRLSHARWYARFASLLAARSEGPGSVGWLAAAVAEAENLQAAIDALDEAGHHEERLQLVADAMTVWFEAGHEQEGERRLGEALAAAGPTAPARAIALTYWAWLHAAVNRPEAASAAVEAVALARRDDDPAVESFALQTLGDTLDDVDAAERASLAVFEAADRAEGRTVRYGPTAPDAVRCGASYNLASVRVHRSVPEALAWQQQALHRAEREGDRRIIAVNAARLSLVHLLAGDPESARARLSRSPGLVSRTVTARWEDIVTYAQGLLAHHEGDELGAEAHLALVHRSATSAGRPLHAVLAAAALADLRTAQGRLEHAADVLERAERVLAGDAEPRRRAVLWARRARIDRLAGDAAAARSRLDAVATLLEPDSLPQERIIWLVEACEHAWTSGSVQTCVDLLEHLHAAALLTGVHLPPWERARVDDLERRVAAPPVVTPRPSAGQGVRTTSTSTRSGPGTPSTA